MNETASDKKPEKPIEKPAEKPKDNLTRVKVLHLYFADNVDVQGHSQISNLKCYPDPAQQPNYHTCDCVPAWQAVEIWE